MRRLTSRHLIVGALMLSAGIGLLFARAVLTLRDDQWDYAQRTNAMLAHTIEQNISRTIDGFDRSLDGVISTLGSFDALHMAPDLRSALLFDHSLRMPGLGEVAVVDAHGDVLVETASPTPRAINVADRDYFRVHLREGFQGLYIGAPVHSRLSGTPSLPLSRAYHDKDGNLAGVVAGALQVGFFHELFASVQLGPQSRIVLWHQDGTMLTRFPEQAAGAPAPHLTPAQLAHMRATEEGTFTDTDAGSGTEMLHAFHQVKGFPLIASVDQPVADIVARWRSSALTLGAFALLLILTSLGLTLAFARELERRQAIGTQLRQAEHDLRTILNNLPSLVGYWDRQLLNRFANDAYRQWLGATPEQLHTRPLPELLSAEEYTLLRPHVDSALQGHRQVFERTRLLPSGERRHMLTRYVPDQDARGVQGFFVQIDDLTERKRVEDLLFDEKERARLTLQSIGDAVLCTDAQGRITYINPAAEALTGWPAFDAAGLPAEEVAALRTPPGQAALHPIARVLGGAGAHTSTRAMALLRRDGTPVEVEESASAITDRHGQVTGAVMVLRDVTQALALARRMTHLAQHDALTGLPNRLLLQDRAQQAIAHARRGGHGLAVMYLDLDGFKQINDTLGHDAGDLLLIQIARRFSAAVRASDTLCRQGGDEFIVLLPTMQQHGQAAAVAHKLLAACAEPVVLPRGQARVGLSGGVAFYPEHGDSFELLARHADTALYAAKTHGRGQFRVYAGPASPPQPLALPSS